MIKGNVFREGVCTSFNLNNRRRNKRIKTTELRVRFREEERKGGPVSDQYVYNYGVRRMSMSNGRSTFFFNSTPPHEGQVFFHRDTTSGTGEGGRKTDLVSMETSVNISTFVFGVRSLPSRPFVRLRRNTTTVTRL